MSLNTRSLKLMLCADLQCKSKYLLRRKMRGGCGLVFAVPTDARECSGTAEQARHIVQQDFHSWNKS